MKKMEMFKKIKELFTMLDELADYGLYNYEEEEKELKDKLLSELMDVNYLWDELLDQELFTEAELRLLTNINGYSVETLNDAIFARYGYKDLEQMMEE